MKVLQRARAERQKPGQDDRIGLDDRIGAAGAALVFGAPTAFLIWLLATAFGAEIHLSLPPRHWALGVWGVLVLCGFVFPRSMDEIFSALWTRILEGFQVVLAIFWR